MSDMTAASQNYCKMAWHEKQCSIMAFVEYVLVSTVSGQNVGHSRNRHGVNIRSSADGHATKSVRGTWYVRHRCCWACARRNDLWKAPYVTLASHRTPSSPLQAFSVP